MRILITGASGMLGRNLIDYFLENSDHQMIAVARDLSGLPATPRLTLVPMDLKRFSESTLSPEIFTSEPKLETIDVFIHAAAITSGPEVPNNLKLFEGAWNLFRWTQGKHFILISSLSVLGEFRTPSGLNEQSQPLPQTAYAQSKLQCEFKLMELAREQSLQSYTIFRPALLYGFYDEGAIARLIRLFKHRGVWIGFGRGQVKKSLTSARNLAFATHVSIMNPASFSRVFHVVDPEPMHFSQLKTILQNLSGKTVLTLELSDSMSLRLIQWMRAVRRILPFLPALDVSIEKALQESTHRSLQLESALKVELPYHFESEIKRIWPSL